MHLDYRESLLVGLVYFSNLLTKVEALAGERSAVELAALLIHFFEVGGKPFLLDDETGQGGKDASSPLGAKSASCQGIRWTRRRVEEMDRHVDPCSHQVRNSLE